MEIVQTMNSDPGLAVGEAGRDEGGAMGRDHGGLGYRADRSALCRPEGLGGSFGAWSWEA